jgi:hypothetical protein
MAALSVWNETPQFRRVYKNTIELVARVRDYISEHQGLQVSAWEDASLQMATTGELSKLTTNLTAAVSWLMMHKALHAREISVTEVIEEGNHLLMEIRSEQTMLFSHDRNSAELYEILHDAANLYTQLETIHASLKRRALN